jgi:dephospho-CoA kinase
MLVIGLTGFAGSGKSTVARYLKEKYNFRTLTISDVLKEAALNRGFITGKEPLEEMKEKLSAFGDILRKETGKQFILGEIVAEKVKNLISQGEERVCVDGFRSVGEVEIFKHNFNFYLIYIYVDEKIRFERRKAEDPNADPKAFHERDQHDIKKGMAETVAIADFKVDNSGSFENTRKQIDKIITKLLRSR